MVYHESTSWIRLGVVHYMQQKLAWCDANRFRLLD